MRHTSRTTPRYPLLLANPCVAAVGGTDASFTEHLYGFRRTTIPRALATVRPLSRGQVLWSLFQVVRACMHAELRPNGVAMALTLAVVQVGVPYVMHKLARIHRRMVEEAVTNPVQAHSHDGSSIDASGQVCITSCLPFYHTDALLSYTHLLHTRQARRTMSWMQHVRAWFLRYFPMVNSGYMLLQLVYHVRCVDLAGPTSMCVSEPRVY